MLRKILAIFLFIGFIVNISHAFFIECEHSHNVKEYVQELDSPKNCDDFCKFHFMFHQNFVLKECSINIQTISFSKRIEIKLPKYSSIYLKSPPKPPKLS